MLRELNSIASDLLGLHGYPVRPLSSPEETSADASTAAKDAGQAALTGKSTTACQPAKAAHARPTFAW
jgi:hypothetical protein